MGTGHILFCGCTFHPVEIHLKKNISYFWDTLIMTGNGQTWVKITIAPESQWLPAWLKYKRINLTSFLGILSERLKGHTETEHRVSDFRKN